MKMDPNLFRSVSHFERYKDFFLKAGIIQERFVDLEDLRNTFIPSCFEGRGWEPCGTRLIFCLQNLTASPPSMDSDPLAISVKMGENFVDWKAEKLLLRGSNVLRGSCQNQRLCLYMLMFWVFVIYMGLIHCGFGVYLFLTHNLYSWFNLLYILLILFRIYCVCTHVLL